MAGIPIELESAGPDVLAPAAMSLDHGSRRAIDADRLPSVIFLCVPVRSLAMVY